MTFEVHTWATKLRLVFPLVTLEFRHLAQILDVLSYLQTKSYPTSYSAKEKDLPLRKFICSRTTKF